MNQLFRKIIFFFNLSVAIIYSLVIGDDTDHKVVFGGHPLQGSVEGTRVGIIQRNLCGRGILDSHPDVDLGQGREEIIDDSLVKTAGRRKMEKGPALQRPCVSNRREIQSYSTNSKA